MRWEGPRGGGLSSVQSVGSTHMCMCRWIGHHVDLELVPGQQCNITKDFGN